MTDYVYIIAEAETGAKQGKLCGAFTTPEACYDYVYLGMPENQRTIAERETGQRLFTHSFANVIDRHGVRFQIIKLVLNR